MTKLHLPVRSLMICLVISFVACNPVKRVLHNPDQFGQVAREVVRRGYCINDTVRRDTTIQVLFKDSLIHDTLKVPTAMSAHYQSVDTVFSSGAHLQIDQQGQILVSCPIKTVTRDITQNHYIRDLKKEQLLQQDIDNRDQRINSLNDARQQLQQQYDQQQRNIRELKATIRNRTIELAGLLLLLIVLIGYTIYKKIHNILPL